MTFRRQQTSRAGLASWARRTQQRATIGGKLTSSALAALTGADIDRMIRSDPSSRRAEIQRLHVLGHTASEISRQLGVDPAAVAAALRANVNQSFNPES